MPGIGGFVIIALVLRHGWQRAQSRAGLLWRRVLALALALVHVAVAPLLLIANCVLLRQLGRANLSVDTGLDAHFQQHRASGSRPPLAGAHVTVLAVTEGRPTSIELTLDGASFDDASVCLLAWRDQRLVPVQLSLHRALGIPWSPGPTGLLRPFRRKTPV